MLSWGATGNWQTHQWQETGPFGKNMAWERLGKAQPLGIRGGFAVPTPPPLAPGFHISGHCPAPSADSSFCVTATTLTPSSCQLKHLCSGKSLWTSRCPSFHSPEAATVLEILHKDFIQEGLPGDTGKGVLLGALAFSMWFWPQIPWVQIPALLTVCPWANPNSPRLKIKLICAKYSARGEW